MRLGTLLLRDAIISLGQLEEALRTQVLYGGRLGTNLVELGSIDLDTLGLYLSKVHRVPHATVARLEAADASAAARLGADLAERHCAYPLGAEPLRPDTIAVAMADPGQHDRIGDLTRRMGCEVAPYVASELRILYYLEQRLGIARRPRFLRQPDGSRPPPGVRERRRTQPPVADSAPVVRFEPRPASSPERSPERSGGGAPDGAARAAPRGRPSPPPRVALADAIGSIAAAQHRNQIADDLIEMTQGRVGAAALLMVRGSNAIGWRGLGAHGRALVGASIETLAVPLGGSSVLQIAFDTQRAYHGPSPAAGRPVERQVWLALGAIEPPADMLVVPILVARRVVNLLYAHGPGGRSIAEPHARELIEVCHAAGTAYVRLIQASRIAER
jgi:Type II secretion system (T2SS), protein E, N-terminal domain